MKIFNKIILFFLLFFLSDFILAQEKVFTIDEAINAALKNNRDIIIAKLNVDKADAAVSEAFGYALPSVDLSANFAHFLEKPRTAFPDFEALLTNASYSILFDENVIPRDNSKFRPIETKLQSFAQTNSYEASVQLTQTLFNSAVFRGIGASKIYSNLSKEELKRVTSETILQVKKAFYGVLLTKKLLEITNASFKNAQENLGNVKAMQQQGFVSEFDLLQAEVRVENIHPVILQMENTLTNAKDGLKIMLGIEQSVVIDVEGEMVYEKEIFPEKEELIVKASEDNYSIKSLQLKKDVDNEFIALDRAEYWPSLYGFANYTYAGSSDKFDFQNYSSAMVGVTFSMNLFMGGQTKNRVEQSELGLRQTEEQIGQLKDFVSSQVKSKINELNRVESIIQAQDRNVKLAEKAYDIATVRYQEGTGSQLEVENADLALRQARINRLQSVYDYIIAQSELNQLLGKVEPEYFNQLNIDWD